MKAVGIPNCISLDQIIIALTVFDHQQTFINCLPSIDLEMRFLGTIFSEMNDFDQTGHDQTLVQMLMLGK